MARAILGPIAAAAAALCSPVTAQDTALPGDPRETPATAEQSEPGPEATAARSIEPSGPVVENRNEIVVTAPGSESGMRVPSTSDDKAAAAAAAARTPCAGCVQVSGSSVQIGFGRPPPMPLMIDLKAIPEAPPGSDAARYGEE